MRRLVFVAVVVMAAAAFFVFTDADAPGPVDDRLERLVEKPRAAVLETPDERIKERLVDALIVEKTYFTDHQQWTADVNLLREYDPELPFAAGDRPSEPGVVHVFVQDPMVVLSAKSESGPCHYLVSNYGAGGGEGYETDERCPSAPELIEEARQERQARQGSAKP